jgi:succinate dehydrogenase / fumarate reductase iron-sulfur subunit
MEIDPLFVGPAALAKAYRFVGDPRDAEPAERLKDLSEDPHGIYDCTHCFNCIDACPKGVDPMSQIMRLRRKAGSDYEIVDGNNGHRHEDAFVTLVRDYGLLNEAELLPRSYGGNSWFGKFHPAAGKELVSSLSTVVTGVIRGKVNPKIAMFGHKLAKGDLASLKRIFATVEGREQRDELNLYVTGYEDDEGAGGGAEKSTGDTEPGVGDRQPPTEPSASAGEEKPDQGPADKSPTYGEGPTDKSPTHPGPGEESQDASSESESQ